MIGRLGLRAPHPSPPETSDRPEGEGTDSGEYARFADLKFLSRTQVLNCTKICSLASVKRRL
ncbi:hypothetical protein C2E19_03750 [Pseudomonas sp. DTU12.3]|nr:hypothetical protein C2E19_03750 [Pseudomonas sp. DTU12.3]